VLESLRYVRPNAGVSSVDINNRYPAQDRQRIGIIPNREVKPTIAGIRSGRDEVLEVAIREIVGKYVADAQIEK
jgi:hypothetical protein